MVKKSDENEDTINKLYCGAKDVPRGKKLADAEYCVKTNQIRYYGIVKVDPKLLEQKKKGQLKTLEDEEMKLHNMKIELNAFIKKAEKLVKIKNNEKSKKSEKTKAIKEIEKMKIKRPKILKDIEIQGKIVEAKRKERDEEEKNKVDLKKVG